jgi:hypothetical protein
MALEDATKLNVIVFDKTGTLTVGQPEVVEIVTADGITEDVVLTAAAVVEQGSAHPLAQAILRRAANLPVAAPTGFESLDGMGARAETAGGTVFLGNRLLMDTQQLALGRLETEASRLQGDGRKRVAFRADAAFAKPEVYEAMEQRNVQYAIRMPANESLEWEIADLLVRPPRRPSQIPLVQYKSFSYQAGSWTRARRIVAKVEHHAGELFRRVGFIVTNLPLPSRAVGRFYNKRGTAEQWIKEGKQAGHWTRLSCHRFRANEVRLQLSVLAYNLGNLWRRLVLPTRIDTWRSPASSSAS